MAKKVSVRPYFDNAKAEVCWEVNQVLKDHKVSASDDQISGFLKSCGEDPQKIAACFINGLIQAKTKGRDDLGYMLTGSPREILRKALGLKGFAQMRRADLIAAVRAANYLEPIKPMEFLAFPDEINDVLSGRRPPLLN